MTMTKTAGAFCGAFLVFLLGKFAAEKIYDMEHHGHGDHGPAYVIDTGGSGDSGAEEDAGPPFAELYAMADVGSGERVFGKCRACHSVEDGANGTGPYLHGVVNRDVDAASGYGYSGALAQVVDAWTPEALNAFLTSPKNYAPGTTMSFNGLAKPEDRANVIAYLDMTDGDMTEVAAPAEEAVDEATAEDGDAAEEEAHSEQ
ncbi:MAG: c-type cytochrome [Pseudomonadota bacterium]